MSIVPVKSFHPSASERRISLMNVSSSILDAVSKSIVKRVCPSPYRNLREQPPLITQSGSICPMTTSAITARNAV